MKNSNTEVETILNYVDRSSGLTCQLFDSGKVQINQEVDGKCFAFFSYEVGDVLQREDSEGKRFLQLNFKNGVKVLLTDTLVGFKPIETFGLDMTRLPKVVTTPDLQSVFKAIEEALASDGNEHELEILKKVYVSILTGAEKIGFDLPFEKKWIQRIAASKLRATA